MIRLSSPVVADIDFGYAVDEVNSVICDAFKRIEKHTHSLQAFSDSHTYEERKKSVGEVNHLLGSCFFEFSHSTGDYNHFDIRVLWGLYCRLRSLSEYFEQFPDDHIFLAMDNDVVYDNILHCLLKPLEDPDGYMSIHIYSADEVEFLLLKGLCKS